MARTAEKLADDVYVTSDNPRTEDPRAIIDEVLTGLTPAGRTRPSSSRTARRRSSGSSRTRGPDDVVLLAGKGHENYQIIGAERRHFDDVEEAKRAIAGSRGIAARVLLVTCYWLLVGLFGRTVEKTSM